MRSVHQPGSAGAVHASRALGQKIYQVIRRAFLGKTWRLWATADGSPNARVVCRGFYVLQSEHDSLKTRLEQLQEHVNALSRLISVTHHPSIPQQSMAVEAASSTPSSGSVFKPQAWERQPQDEPPVNLQPGRPLQEGSAGSREDAVGVLEELAMGKLLQHIPLHRVGTMYQCSHDSQGLGKMLLQPILSQITATPSRA